MKTLNLRSWLLRLSAFSAMALPSAFAQERGKGDAFRSRVLPILERYCVDCHSTDDPEAGISLDRFRDQAEAVEDGKTWLRVRDAMEGHLMPPTEAPQPSAKERDVLTGWIEADFLAAQCGKQAGAAPVVIRRLNRQEYNNTIRDLLGVDLRLADAFPPDDIGFGFDNVGSALNISPVHVEKYLDAAERRAPRGDRPARRQGLPARRTHRADRTYPLPPAQPVEFPHSRSSLDATWPTSASSASASTRIGRAPPTR